MAQIPLTFEQLLEMDGEPVWYCNVWWIVWAQSDEEEVYLQTPLTCPLDFLVSGISQRCECWTNCVLVNTSEMDIYPTKQ